MRVRWVLGVVLVCVLASSISAWEVATRARVSAGYVTLVYRAEGASCYAEVGLEGYVEVDATEIVAESAWCSVRVTFHSTGDFYRGWSLGIPGSGSCGVAGGESVYRMIYEWAGCRPTA